MQRHVTVAFALLLALAPAAGAEDAASLKNKRVFMAVMNGGQVVPPSISNAIGNAYLTFDTLTKRLCYSISYSGLVGLETEAHVHAGATGTTDAVVFGLTPAGSPKVGCVGPLARTEEKLLMRGRMYINIHTDVYVAGEIRGQILPMPAVR